MTNKKALNILCGKEEGNKEEAEKFLEKELDMFEDICIYCTEIILDNIDECIENYEECLRCAVIVNNEKLVKSYGGTLETFKKIKEYLK